MAENKATIHNLDDAPPPPSENLKTLKLSGGVLSPPISPLTSQLSWRPKTPPSPSARSHSLDMPYMPEEDEDEDENEARDQLSEIGLSTEFSLGNRRGSAPGRLDMADTDDMSIELSSRVRSERVSGEILDGSHLQSSVWNDGLDDVDDDDAQWSGNEDDQLDLGSSIRPKTVLGYEIPAWWTKGPSWSRISAFVVRHAPCFWCCGSVLEIGATDRSILYRLNVLCSFFATGQVVSGIFLVVAFYSGDIVERNDFVVGRSESASLTPNLWNVNGGVFLLALIGAVVLVTMLYTLRIVREVNLVGAIRYMWIMVWLIPLQIFVVISVFDYHGVTRVWIRHWWSVPSLAWFRSIFCRESTFNTLCIVPVLGGEGFDNEHDWCMFFYNATNCTDIRDDAQATFQTVAQSFYVVNLVWGLLHYVLLVLVVNVLEGIITKPVVQSSKESNVPAWLLLPTSGSLAVGFTFLYGQSSVLSAQTGYRWVGVLFTVTGGFFLMASLLGWFISAFSILNSRDKQNKNIGVLLLIGTMGINVALIGAIFVGSILLATSLVNVPLGDEERGRLACLIDGSQSCTDCNNDTGMRECPEWQELEVVKVLQAQLKQSATVAAIFWLYAFNTLRFGFALRKHISMYQIDYV